MFDGFLEEGLVLAVVFGRGAGLLDDICEVEMQRKMFLEIGSWRCTFKNREFDMQRGEMSRNCGRRVGDGILMASTSISRVLLPSSQTQIYQSSSISPPLELRTLLKIDLPSCLSNLYEPLTASLKGMMLVIRHTVMKRGRPSSWVW